MKQEIFELETLNGYLKTKNQTLKENNGIQISKRYNLILPLSLWYKKNKKLNKENREMKREIINLKYNILMGKPRMAVAAKKKKNVKYGCDSKDIWENDNVVFY